MKLPNAHLAIVEREKICDYLLNPDHRFGASKARFFFAFDFRVETWEILANALRKHAQQHEVSKVQETGYGLRYQVDGELRAPDGGRPRVRAVWQVDDGQIAPRLITVYPLEAI